MNYQFMGYYFTSTQLIVAAVVLVVVVAIAIAAFVQYRRTRTLAFRSRFGTEYDRAVVTHGSPQKAEAKLADRETRVEALKIREIGATERDRFITEWHAVQSRFVDHPKAAVTEADDLINTLLEARGYPRTGFEQRAADVSVHYPRVMENYRHAHSIAVRLGQGEATTEELRTAMIQYRTIFDDLVQVKTPSEVRTAA
jgi:HAMP domain-containing protein